MKKVKKKGNILLLPQRRPKTSNDVDRKIAEIMLPKVLAASDDNFSVTAYVMNETQSIAKVGYRFKVIKITVCLLFFIAIVLSSANLALLAMIPQVGASTFVLVGFLVIISGALYARAILFDIGNCSVETPNNKLISDP